MVINEIPHETELEVVHLDLGIAVQMVAADGRKYVSDVTRSIQLQRGQVMHDQAVELLIEISDAHTKMLRSAGLPSWDDRLEIVPEV